VVFDCRAVVRLHTTFITVENKTEEFHGTAFFVSKNKLVTSQHNLHSYKGIIPSSITFTLNERGKTEKMRIRYPLNIIKSEHKTNIDLDPITDAPLLTHSDFEFLQSDSYESDSFLVPCTVKKDEVVAVMGYNQPPDPVDVIQTFAAPEIDLKDPSNSMRLIGMGALFSGRIASAFHTWNVLSVSPGKVVNTKSFILAHSGSTMKGASGSPLICLPVRTFCGIHVCAGTQFTDNTKQHLLPTEIRNHNLAISVYHPDFKAAYLQHVFPDLKDLSPTDSRHSFLQEYVQNS